MTVPPDAPPTEGLTFDQLEDRLKQHLTDTVSPVNERLKAIEDTNKAIQERQDAQKAELDALADAERAKGDMGYTPPADPEHPDKPSLGKMILGHMGNWERGLKSDFPLEYQLAHEQADFLTKTVGQQAGIGSYGGLLVSPQVFPGIMDALRPASVLVQAMQAAGSGANVLENLTGGPLHFNRAEGGLTATRKGESAPGPAAGRETFESMELRPLEVMARVSTSNALLRQDTSGAISRHLEARLGQELGIKMDYDGFKGAGGNTPVGIENTPTDVGSGPAATTSWGSADYAGADQNVSDLLEDMVVAIKARNGFGLFGEYFWFGNPQGFSKIRKTKDADGHPMPFFERQYGSSGMGVATDDRLIGHRYAESTQLSYGTTTDDLYLVPMGAFYWAMWGAIEIVANPFSATEFANNDLQIRAVAYQDSGLLRGALMQKASAWDNS